LAKFKTSSGKAHRTTTKNLIFCIIYRKTQWIWGELALITQRHHAQAKYTYTPDLPHERTDHPTPVD